MKIFGSIFFLLGMTSVYGQTFQPEVISSSGEFLSDSAFTISYTLGEILTETVSDTSVILTQGFHQPASATIVVSNIENSGSKDLQISIYPNPTDGVLNIYIESMVDFPVFLNIYDSSGKLLMDRKVANSETNININMKLFASGIYYLEVKNNFKEILKQYQIQKM